MSNKTKKLLGNLTRNHESDSLEETNQSNQDAKVEVKSIATSEEPVIASDTKKKRRVDSHLKDYKVHSFVVDLKDLDYLFKLVDHMKYSGHINFSQKEALSMAISFLKKKYPENDLLSKPRF